MTDLVLLVLALAATTAAGLLALRMLRALPVAPGERLLAGLAVGLGLAGMAGLGLAAAGQLRATPIALLGAAALLAGGRALARAGRALDARALGRVWPLVLVCALVLATEVPTMLAPPVGGDQTKYQLVYPRLYALAGGLVPTPWSFWGQMQFLPNFVFALAFAASGDVLARLLNGAMGVAAVLALATLVGARLAPRAGAIAGALFFTLPITWSLMTHAGVDLAVVLYTALGTAAFLAWAAEGRGGDLRRAALMAGLAAGSKPMALQVPALLGAAVLAVLAWRAEPGRRLARAGEHGCGPVRARLRPRAPPRAPAAVRRARHGGRRPRLRGHRRVGGVGGSALRRPRCGPHADRRGAGGEGAPPAPALRGRRHAHARREPGPHHAPPPAALARPGASRRGAAHAGGVPPPPLGALRLLGARQRRGAGCGARAG